ncbi:hypothetical protein B0T24DRAFT_692059 [Lasiosphaeria ovina]|uniref:AAA+ ATPase domain-containing protein n=1 Tax=Lasiosphaeria ovina TaxID=92902 RepID=A0AAE0JSS9_9PEZI|nr:hypothetical protein B0T24DRAFT_692059 [Lasiosphaeria ovina]
MDSLDQKPDTIGEGSQPAPTKNEDTKVPAEPAVKLEKADAKKHDKREGKKKAVEGKGAKKQRKSKLQRSKKQVSVSGGSSDSASDDSNGGSSPSSSASSDDLPGSDESPRKRTPKKGRGVKKQAPSRKREKAVKWKRPKVSDSDSDSDSTSARSIAGNNSVNNREQGLSKQLQLVKLQQLQQDRNPPQYSNSEHWNDNNGHRQYGNSSYQSLGSQFGNAGIMGGVPVGVYDLKYRASPVDPAGGRFEGYPRSRPNFGTGGTDANLPPDGTKPRPKKEDKRSTAKLDFKRVDHVWDNKVHDYRLQDTAKSTLDAQYDQYLFHVRRSIDWEGKYKTTTVDIKSMLLAECLRTVIGSVRGVSLVEDTPKLDPNMLFLYLEDFRRYLGELKATKVSKGGKHDRKKEQKHINLKRQHLKVLVRYIDKDFAEVKSSLYPMLENGIITFDLLWALWKPNTLAFTNTYGSQDEPRAFRAETAERHSSIVRDDFYLICGKYFEYDGKQFGYGAMYSEVKEFRGTRRITSLNCYPLKYHKHETQLRKDLIARGRKFVSLSGVQYKSHQGLAFYKKRKSVVKVNVNGRIMVDPGTHRRINPNYPISHIRPRDRDVISDDSENSGDESCGCTDSDSDGDGSRVKYVTKLTRDEKGNVYQIRTPESPVGDNDTSNEKLDRVLSRNSKAVRQSSEDSATDSNSTNEMSLSKIKDEDYLISSPVVLGFAFAEKMWLEFTVSEVKEIRWNEGAYESLVLEPKTKDIVQALVESNKYHAAESIDDVIHGKGKGLVAVLHGPPGTGKTLTAEGISELLKCPLYMASAGELGTDSRYLESELQRILDICHVWGAILLLDEADVFLEKRNMHDIHRNALVSVFLRQLEYFQGILFLTTNRVQTFDDAFQSRIHIALRYDILNKRARMAIFKIFIERVRALDKADDMLVFTKEDYESMSKQELNGRQIKNTVRTAQALAVNKGEPLSMRHLRQVLEVQRNFDHDLKGGPGFEDAMKIYA